MFSKKVIEHCQNPRNVGKLDDNSKDVGMGLVGSAVCGDMLQFWLKIENNIVKDAKFKTFGCGGAISSSSLMTEKIIGKTIDEALDISNKQLVEELELPPIKFHCSVMSEEAIAKAIYNYLGKNSLQITDKLQKKIDKINKNNHAH
ncbi:MAG: iron-sulfur cluster assembly scaffold protein [Rickettsiales bacterium]|jgi:nitrogen fixation NifU-like protein|nr:iron-sulfur cluster assembly scaffold protein [Rickettsiales bacterium]